MRKLKAEAYRNNYCMKYMRGFCEEGSRCKWIHPELEVAPWIRDQGVLAEQSRVDDEGERASVVEIGESMPEGNDSQVSEELIERDGGELVGADAIMPEIVDVDSDSDTMLKWIQKEREEMGNREK